MKHAFWTFANIYAKILGQQWLAPLHRSFATLSLHALGYDNARFTGEEWFISKILKKADIQVAIDIGANVGAYSSTLLQNLGCNVFAIEPSSSSFSELEKVALEYKDRLYLTKGAISDFDGTATLFSKGALSETATLDKQLLAHPNIEEEVVVMTVDSFVEKAGLTQIDFIKIDTEGFEKEVLLGMQKTIADFAPTYIQFEFNLLHLNRGVTLLSLTQMLPGYRFYRLLPQGWLSIDPSRFINEIFMFSNIVAVRN